MFNIKETFKIDSLDFVLLVTDYIKSVIDND